MPIYKIIIPIIASIMLWRWFSLLLKWKIEWREFVFWLIFWWIFAIIATYPNVIEILARVTWIQDSVKAVFALIIMILSFAILRLILATESLERDITKIVRFNALENFKNKKYVNKIS